MKSITIKKTTYPFPIYLPDATLGVVRNISSQQVAEAGIEGVVINTFHLMTKPGVEILKQAGNAKKNQHGIKPFMNWQGLTASDSGGFQLFSLIHKNPKLGRIIDDGVVLYSGEKQQRKTLFTPEESIKIQFEINSDIMICLDDFSPVKASPKRLIESVERTTSWAKRCKIEFEKQIKKRGFTEKTRPHLFAVIQGHDDKKLRKKSAQELKKIGFDGYGLGGWPFDKQGNFDYEICQVVADLTPDEKPRFALGIGTPENIIRLRKMGYDIFDCVLPTRDARHKRIYIFDKNGKPSFLYLRKSKHATDFSPLEKNCDCQTCRNHTKAYLHHLFKINDGLAYQLTTIHNLRFYARIIEKLRAEEKNLSRKKP